MPVQKTLAVILCYAIFAVPVRAQQIIPPGAIDQALTERATDITTKQQTIRTALRQPDVVRVAESLGLDIARADASVATLAGADLDRVAAQAQLVNDEIAGGQTVRLNLLWIIIGLLVVILIIVAS
jgi:hypothetical protein